jgi:hypothetical protein
MIFRRFYLSNSVIDFHPRNVAAASALLAVKVDCENKLEVSFFNKQSIDICMSFYTVFVVMCYIEIFASSRATANLITIGS